MASEWLIDTEPFLFKHACEHFIQNMYLVSVLTTLSLHLRWHAIPLARYLKRWQLRTHSVWEKSVRFPILINTDHLFICNASSRIIKCQLYRSFYHLTIYAYCEGISTRELPARFVGFVTVRNILSFERLWEINSTKSKLSVHASYRTHQLSNFWASLIARFKQILIRFNNKFRIVTTKRIVTRLGERTFHTKWH